MKKLAIWLTVIIIFQLSIYTFADQVLLVPSVSFSQNLVETYQKNGSTNLISYDGTYVARTTDSGVDILQANNNEVQYHLDLNEKESVTYFSWLPDRYVALVGINKEEKNTATVILKPINLETGSQPEEPSIKGLPKQARIADVTFSTATNVIYLNVKNHNKATVYRIDANNNIRKVKTTQWIGKIDSLKSKDALVYDSTTKNRVYVRYKGSAKQVSPSDGQYALLGVDKSDTIYIGQLDADGKVIAVLEGNMDGDFTVLKEMPQAYSVDSVVVTYDGDVRTI
ncbi:MAG: hypothetical protein ACM3PP_08350 [Candidatus Saccharibacteria bacterium]